jgi:hypothetical protein
MNRRKWLWGAAGVAAVGLGGAKLLRGFEGDPAEDFAELPPSLRRSALDVHVHAIGTGTGGSGCWMSEQMRGSIQTKAGLWNLRLSLDDPGLDQKYIEYLRSRISAAGFLKQVVLLAMDHVYRSDGSRDEQHTPFYTPNDYVARLAREYPEFIFGASIHPYRRDALDELDRVAEAGAVLIKWIPNVQGMHLSDPVCRGMYRRMAEKGIALLTHVGDEQALFIASQELGEPRRLVTPLEEGVTVIAAHAGSLGERDGKSNFHLLAEMFPRWPNLYADTSALTLLTRWRTPARLMERPELHSRLIHGSDFPIPPAASSYFGSISLGRWWDAWKRENPLRRDFEIKQAIGLPPEIYTRGYSVRNSPA